MFLSPKNSYIEALTPVWWYWEVGPLGGRFRGGHDGFSVPMGKRDGSSFSPSSGHMRHCKRVATCQPEKRSHQ